MVAMEEPKAYLCTESVGFDMVITRFIVPENEFRQCSRKDSTCEEITP